MSSRCRLSLSEIPHTYDHCLEVDTDAEDDLESVELEPQENSKPNATEKWPDGYATSFILFMLFNANASIFIIWLVLAPPSGHPSSPDIDNANLWKIGSFGMPIGSMILNLLHTWIAKRWLQSKSVAISSGIFAIAWIILLLRGNPSR